MLGSLKYNKRWEEGRKGRKETVRKEEGVKEGRRMMLRSAEKKQ